MIYIAPGEIIDDGIISRLMTPEDYRCLTLPELIEKEQDALNELPYQENLRQNIPGSMTGWDAVKILNLRQGRWLWKIILRKKARMSG